MHITYQCNIMSIFDFHVTDTNLEQSDIDRLVVASRYYKCTVEQQRILKEIALMGQAVIEQEGVHKEAEVIAFLSSSPFIVSNDFGLICDPLYREIRVNNNKIFIEGSNTRFYEILRVMDDQYTLDEVSFKNQSTCRFFFYWTQHGKPDDLQFLYSELREVLDLKKGNYKAFVHHERVLLTIKNELHSIGIKLAYAKYPEGTTRAKGVVMQIDTTNENFSNL